VCFVYCLCNTCEVCDSTGPVLFHWSGPVGPDLVSLFACGTRKRMARSGLASEKERAHYSLVIILVLLLLHSIALEDMLLLLL